MKELLKAALIEVLTGRQDLLANAVREAMEDYVLDKAVAEGREPYRANREAAPSVFGGGLPALATSTEDTARPATYWLEQLVATAAFADLENAVEWQRSIRKDRHLPR